jgi:hypothetical protein
MITVQWLPIAVWIAWDLLMDRLRSRQTRPDPAHGE